MFSVVPIPPPPKGTKARGGTTNNWQQQTHYHSFICTLTLNIHRWQVIKKQI